MLSYHYNIANILKEWDQIQSKLKRSKLLSKFVLKRVAMRKFYLDLYYHHEPADLVNELLDLGLSVHESRGSLVLELR